jgi:hypothetical protein
MTNCNTTAADRITLRFRMADVVNEMHHFRTLAGARKFAVRLLGAAPEFNLDRAVNPDDGLTTIECVAGCTVADLFTA